MSGDLLYPSQPRFESLMETPPEPSVRGIDFELQFSVLHDQVTVAGQLGFQRVIDEQRQSVVVLGDPRCPLGRFIVRAAAVTDDADQIVVPGQPMRLGQGLD